MSGRRPSSSAAPRPTWSRARDTRAAVEHLLAPDARDTWHGRLRLEESRRVAARSSRWVREPDVAERFHAVDPLCAEALSGNPHLTSAGAERLAARWTAPAARLEARALRRLAARRLLTRTSPAIQTLLSLVRAHAPFRTSYGALDLAEVACLVRDLTRAEYRLLTRAITEGSRTRHALLAVLHHPLADPEAWLAVIRAAAYFPEVLVRLARLPRARTHTVVRHRLRSRGDPYVDQVLICDEAAEHLPAMLDRIREAGQRDVALIASVMAVREFRARTDLPREALLLWLVAPAPHLREAGALLVAQAAPVTSRPSTVRRR